MKPFVVNPSTFFFPLKIKFFLSDEILLKIKQSMYDKKILIDLLGKFDSDLDSDRVLDVEDLFGTSYNNEVEKINAILLIIFKNYYETEKIDKYLRLITAFQKKKKLPKNIVVLLAEEIRDYTSEKFFQKFENFDGKTTAVFFILGSKSDEFEINLETSLKKSICYSTLEEKMFFPLSKNNCLVVTEYTIESDLQQIQIDNRTRKSKEYLIPRIK